MCTNNLFEKSSNLFEKSNSLFEKSNNLYEKIEYQENIVVIISFFLTHNREYCIAVSSVCLSSVPNNFLIMPFRAPLLSVDALFFGGVKRNHRKTKKSKKKFFILI